MSITRSLLVAIAVALLMPSLGSAATIPVDEFAGTNGMVDVATGTTMEFSLGDVLFAGSPSGLTIDPFVVDVSVFPVNPGGVDVSDIVISGFDGGDTITFTTSNQILETLPPFFGIGIGAITLSVSTDNPSAVKDGNTYEFNVSQMVITYQGPVVTASAVSEGSVVAGPIASASLTAVPEPSTLLLTLGAGLCGLVFFGRRRKR